MKRMVYAMACFWVLVLSGSALAGDVHATWALPANLTGIGFYRLFWGPVSRGTNEQQSAYPNMLDVPGGNTAVSATIPGLAAGTYFASVMSIGPVGSGAQSLFSNEVQFSALLPAPNGLVITFTFTVP